jgi:heavy-metal-associated domain
MKKVISVGDLCCERCANRLACKLELCDGVVKAKANYKKNSIFVEVLSGVPDDELKDAVQSAGFEVLSIAPRKSIFA